MYARFGDVNIGDVYKVCVFPFCVPGDHAFVAEGKPFCA